jgi:hypothetical protein
VVAEGGYMLAGEYGLKGSFACAPRQVRQVGQVVGSRRLGR